MKQFCITILLSISLSAYCENFNYAPSPEEKNEALVNFPYYTGTITPTPQEVRYGDEFFDLSDVLITPEKNVEKDSASLKLWSKRITLCGGKYSFTSNNPSLHVKFQIDEKDLKKEAYTVKISGPAEIEITAHDWTGLTWAFLSLVQLTTNSEGKAVMRKAEIRDWPSVSCPRAVWANYSFKDTLPALLQGHLNRVVFYRGQLIMDKPLRELNDYRYFFTKDPNPEWIASVKEAASICNKLGIELFIGFLPMRVPGLKPENKFNAADSKQVEYLLKNWLAVAEAGANIYIGYDDYRFPRHPEEIKKFATVRDADSYILNYLYSEVKRQYPSVKLIFCPPFYWGPAYNPSSEYGEDRDEYLKAMGEKLDKSIDIAWTGKASWGGKIKKKESDWIASLIRRKPLYFQNDTACPHFKAAFYLTDPSDIWFWPYEGFYGDISEIFIGTAIGSRIFPALGGACLWNLKAYNADTVKEIDEKFFGKDSWPYADELNKALSDIEVYEWKINTASIRDIAKIKEATARLNHAWATAVKFNAPAFKTFAAGIIPLSIQRQNTFCTELEKMKKEGKYDPMTAIENDKKSASVECSLNDQEDIFLSALDFSGGDLPKMYALAQSDKRLGTMIRSKDFKIHTLKTTFKIPLPSPRKTYTLIISAQGDDSKEQGLPSQCRISVKINGNIVFSGPAPFVNGAWTIHTLEVKGSLLRKGENILSIESLEEKGDFRGPPFFILNYAVFKRLAIK